MAFKMKRPLIKGTPIHKASIAKAKAESNSIVSQARTQSDGNLVQSGRLLGDSMVGSSIDYELPKMEIDFAEKEEKEQGERKKGKRKKTEKQRWKDGIEVPDIEQSPNYSDEFKGIGDGSVSSRIRRFRTRGKPRGKEEAVEGLEIKELKQLPSSKKKEELMQSTSTANTNTQTNDKFFVAAKKAGIDINNNEDYAKAERMLVYDESIDNWRERTPTTSVNEVFVGDNPEALETAISKGDDQFKEMVQAGGQYGLGGLDMQSDGEGGYVPKEGAKSQYGETWDAEAGGWRDDGNEQYFQSTGGKTSEKNAIEFGEKREAQLVKKQEKEKKREAENKIIRENNKVIRENNKVIAAAKKYYGPDVTLTKKKLQQYEDMLEKEAADEQWEQDNEIIEQDDPEVGDADYNVMEHGSLDDKKQYQDNISLNSKTPQQQPVVDDTLLPQPPKPKEKKTLSNLEIRKKKQADKKYTNPNTSQYIKDQMLKEGYVPPENESPTQMRQSKTFNNAIPGGVVQQAMLKSGYKQK